MSSSLNLSALRKDSGKVAALHSQDLQRPSEPTRLHDKTTNNKTAKAHNFEAWLVGTKAESYCISL
jgi:hypothetical protein